MSGGIIENNVNTASGGNGGGVWLSDGASVISGGTIRNNTAVNGSAIQLNDSGQLTIQGEAEIDGEINTISKAVNIDGYLGDKEFTLVVKSGTADGTRIATATVNANVYNAAQALNVKGYYTYVVDNNIYITKDDLTGDVDMNGTLDAADVALVLKSVSGSDTGDAFSTKRADVNENGEVDIKDAIALRNKIN
jgi:hypothetical protein